VFEYGWTFFETAIDELIEYQEKMSEQQGQQ